MSRIEEAFKQVRRTEKGEPQPTALHKLRLEHERQLAQAFLNKLGKDND